VDTLNTGHGTEVGFVIARIAVLIGFANGWFVTKLKIPHFWLHWACCWWCAELPFMSRGFTGTLVIGRAAQDPRGEYHQPDSFMRHSSG
jgi:hypothetical protein